ncbi:MAG TPA: hypothetical protein P5519_09890 [Spirochaetia bacterium]|nr:hypothetical protein [Acetomicrobium sp.]HPD81196.1 hypothetical protein [Spirochaetales bacterium]HRS66180.1 hypothetical protein [Spirochaetia bacterium]HRV28888.1 hypothetical protein [Spirochaetia bacterium]
MLVNSKTKDNQEPLRTLTIRLTRLPDIHSYEAAEAHGFYYYGRFAVTRTGGFFFAETISSHPSETKIGWYWAIAKADEVLVSARGAAIDGEILFKEYAPALALLVEALVKRHYIAKPQRIRTIF